MILVETGNDVALNVFLRRRIEDRFRWRARYVLAYERRQYRDVDAFERQRGGEREVGNTHRVSFPGFPRTQIDFLDWLPDVLQRSVGLCSHDCSPLDGAAGRAARGNGDVLRNLAAVDDLMPADSDIADDETQASGDFVLEPQDHTWRPAYDPPVVVDR